MERLPTTVIFGATETSDATEYVLINNERYVSSDGRSFDATELDDEIEACAKIRRAWVLVFNPKGVRLPSLLHIH